MNPQSPCLPVGQVDFAPHIHYTKYYGSHHRWAAFEEKNLVSITRRIAPGLYELTAEEGARYAITNRNHLDMVGPWEVWPLDLNGSYRNIPAVGHYFSLRDAKASLG